MHVFVCAVVQQREQQRAKKKSLFGSVVEWVSGSRMGKWVSGGGMGEWVSGSRMDKWWQNG